MSKQSINIGTAPNDGTGDQLRTGAQKINSNFDEVYGINGILKSNGVDTLSSAIPDVDYLLPSTAASTYEPLKGTDDNYVTDAEKIKLSNLSGVNTGDQVSSDFTHNDLQDVGTNTHAQIDSHISNSTIHYTQSSISITSSQISNFSESVDDRISSLIQNGTGLT
jgi:hypothetical protein